MTEHAVMGQFLKNYKPALYNANRTINAVVAPSRRMSLVQGAVIVQQKQIPDVSYYQANIDWELMRDMTDAVVIRAGQNLWEDPQFRVNWAKAKLQGMKRGVYWFYDDRVDPGKQAELLVRLIQYDLPELDVWCDWETSYGGAFGSLNNVVAFMQAVERALPTAWVGMYTGYWWFREHTNAVTNAAQYNYLKNRPLWEAWYTDNPADVRIPAPWTELDYWQFGTPATGHLYGVQTAEIDMSVFNGTVAEFYARYGSDTVPNLPQEPTTEEQMNYFKVTAGQLNLRAAGAATAADIGDVYANDVLQCGELVNGWRQVFAIWRNNAPVALPAPVVWAHGAYMVATTFVPPAPAAVYPVSAEVTMSDGSKWSGSFTRA